MFGEYFGFTGESVTAKIQEYAAKVLNEI